MASDQPATGTTPSAISPDSAPGAGPNPAPPLAPSDPPSSWWSAPGGKPISIPDFAHELRALAALLSPAPRLMPLRMRARQR